MNNRTRKKNVDKTEKWGGQKAVRVKYKINEKKQIDRRIIKRSG